MPLYQSVRQWTNQMNKLITLNYNYPEIPNSFSCLLQRLLQSRVGHTFWNHQYVTHFAITSLSNVLQSPTHNTPCSHQHVTHFECSELCNHHHAINSLSTTMQRTLQSQECNEICNHHHAINLTITTMQSTLQSPQCNGLCNHHHAIHSATISVPQTHHWSAAQSAVTSMQCILQSPSCHSKQSPTYQSPACSAFCTHRRATANSLQHTSHSPMKPENVTAQRPGLTTHHFKLD